MARQQSEQGSTGVISYCIAVIDAIPDKELPILTPQRHYKQFTDGLRELLLTPAQASCSAEPGRTASRAGTHHHRSRRPHAADSRPRTRRRGESGCHAQGEQTEIGRHRLKRSVQTPKHRSRATNRP